MGDEADHFVESFWYWSNFSTYVLCLLLISVICSVATYFFEKNELYVYLLGTLSAGIESLLGTPQLWLNFSRKHTFGLSFVMICMWLIGDMYKVSYYTNKDSPIQLVFGGLFSVTVDCLIISQFWFYR